MAEGGIVQKANEWFQFLERISIIKKTPNYVYDYHEDYPSLKLLEEKHEVVRKECENILTFKEDITDIESLSSSTRGGIHAIEWKSFMFKSGVFIEENCALCPETAKILKRIKGVRTAFFSILNPNQYIAPHEGYYYGFMRYHLGVVIPKNNADKKCWLRIANEKVDHELLPEKGDKYYWENGKGIVFNDNYSHDASNESDEIRVILWLDIERKLPFVLAKINQLMLNIAFSTKGVKAISKNAVIHKKNGS